MIYNNHTNNERTNGYHRVTQRSNNQQTSYEIIQNSDDQIRLNSNLNLRNNQGKYIGDIIFKY